MRGPNRNYDISSLKIITQPFAAFSATAPAFIMA